jgi:hypothetical protein
LADYHSVCEVCVTCLFVVVCAANKVARCVCLCNVCYMTGCDKTDAVYCVFGVV